MFLIVLTAVSNQDIHGSGYEDDSTTASTADCVSTSIFYPVVVAALLVGVIIGSITTLLIMAKASKKCSMNNSVQFSKSKEADFNESKRYLPSSNVSPPPAIPSSDELGAANSGTINKTKPLPPPNKHKPPNTAPKIPIKKTDKTGNNKPMGKVDNISSVDPVKMPAPATTARMPRSISQGNTAPSLHTTTAPPTTSEEAELHVNNEELSLTVSSRQDEEHYYSCDMSRETGNNKRVTSPATTSTSTITTLPTHSNDTKEHIRDPTHTTAGAIGGGGAKKKTSSQQSTASAHANQQSTDDDTPQYCNVGIKLKDEKR